MTAEMDEILTNMRDIGRVDFAYLFMFELQLSKIINFFALKPKFSASNDIGLFLGPWGVILSPMGIKVASRQFFLCITKLFFTELLVSELAKPVM